MSTPVPREEARWRVLPCLGGTDLLHAHYVRHSFSRHFHEGYAFGVIEQGAMRFRYLGGDQVAARGEINLVEPGEVHDGHAAIDEGWTYRMIYLKPEALETVAAELGRRSGLPAFQRGVLHDVELARRLRRAHQALMRPETGSLERETRLLFLLAAIVTRHSLEPAPPKRRGSEPGAVARARDLLHAKLDEDVRLDDLALETGLSPFHLARVFQRHMGLPPHAYLLQIRLDQVRERLPGPARLADLAAEAGFADQSHLTRLFKARFGLTPGRYRAMLQGS